MFEYHLSARGYEMDSYGHVNNAVYLNYMEQARWEIMYEQKILDKLRDTGNKLVVTELNVRYVREIKLFDDIVVLTKIKKEAPYLVFQHKIKNETTGLLAARANVKTILLNSENMPVDLPDELVNLTDKM